MSFAAETLSNVSAWTNSSRVLVTNSLARYEPFGNYLTTPATTTNPTITQ
jgi:hypothetical protein